QQPAEVAEHPRHVALPQVREGVGVAGLHPQHQHHVGVVEVAAGSLRRRVPLLSGTGQGRHVLLQVIRLLPQPAWAGPSTGSSTPKVLPCPSSLSTVMWPPISSTYSFTIASPNPACRSSALRDGSAR